MEIQDFKRWHWVLIALVIGAVLAYTRTMVTPDESGAGRGVGISAKEFADNVVRIKTGNGYEWVKDVVVYPPTSISEAGTGEKKQVYFVSCSMLTPATNGKYKYKPAQFNAEVPFQFGRNKAPSETFTVRDYLDDAKKNNPEIQYQFAWWAQPRTQTAIWMGGAVILIGGIWPSLISLMVGAGLGGEKKQKDAFDLASYKGKSEQERKVLKAGMTDADQDKLREMEERMEANLASAGMKLTDAPGEPALAGKVAPGIRKLEGGPVEPVAVADKPSDPQEYGGQYYPVAKPQGTPQKH